MGAIIGMSNEYLLLYVTVLGICGLVAGPLKRLEGCLFHYPFNNFCYN